MRKGKKALRLDALKSNLPAQKMYEKAGFTYRGEQRLFAERKRDLCRALLGFLSEIREAKCLAEEKARKALSDNEEYRWIIKMADAVEDDYEFLIFHKEDEGMKEIDRIEERMVKGVREFKERSNS